LIPPWHVISLNSAVPLQDGGHLSDRELARLRTELALHPKAPTLVALHHPPVELGSRWLDALGLSEADRFWAVLEQNPQVRGVVFGHGHQAYDSIRGSIRVLGAPATCAQFLPGSDDFAVDDRPPGWRVLTLHPDGHLDTEVRWLEAP
jgi:Icc protein